ncbi:protein containing duf1549 : Uncharacterized protein OS=Planctomyces limnophilus (strain ATCC 43296 / DSM 3776 / IFAM 1008 / 290) GN=Plim_1739 PE=4 SV=1: PSCyt1: PSCyt2: PSD1 [Gemmataceae bacterium]|nr:protein containing duf1549 : Uncharacterized protein OS=Planctomyces limnophilus (strain ATCC 43296 / DSM 3776 / IFAM 1008 / 290) GN=Plim_1739 PE=4 SV=1: PSCyt1: PSCyt2: PSD1 [Gemmataceae bacterium]VTT96859.1 protein containing duf1549 : Uncharacterized protein OS=Planctomyces limnophilus (strain ATCC 43296 / DSM 3776 / IFAM 1008 / 290) GN=Plim_1739 PE=4 SV=1: PSCyt1: PSCyt2: PSD1 [Gemmataceae bacterium]
MTRLSLAALVLLPAAATAAPPDFAADVAPILERHCVRCHQPGNAKGKVSVATPADLLDNEHVVPGKPAESGVLDLLVPEAPGKRPRMPKEGKALTAAEVATLREWIAAGAAWPKEVVVKERSKADKSWWSLRPLADPTPPDPQGLPKAWAANPVDRFVFAKLAEKGLAPSPPADPRTLVRRVTFDLTGLPPTPEAIEAFAKDPSDAAFAKLVDDLLASPAYGERWGRHWLDVVRFGESNGFERNVIIDTAWPFRDYVIRSFNDAKPFDRLVREHLAGDVIGPGDPAVEVGTAFLVTGPYDNVGNQDAVQAAVIRANTLDEMVRATGEAFLGVTVGCARCHNHKFDPITQQDYHRLAAAVAGVFHGERPIGTPEQAKKVAAARAALDKKRAEQASLLKRTTPAAAVLGFPAVAARQSAQAAGVAAAEAEVRSLGNVPVWWAGQFRAANGPFHVFVGGDPQKKGDAVAFASPAFLSESAKGFDLPPSATEAQRRTALAEWIVSRDNPLTARVLANRVWGWHFGTGIVETPSDFGYMGGKPMHPELLDWIARRIHAENWKLKPVHRLIVTSRAYRQASAYRADAASVDGDSRLLWRFPPRRLSGEEVRDAMLSVSGKLDRKPGGPGFRLYKYVQDNVATYFPLDAPGPETYRRAVYHQNARAARVDVLTDFDCPDPAGAAPKRASTTTPMQALALFNHKFTLDMADALAARARADAGPEPDAQVRRLFALAYGRSPSAEELAAASKVAQAHGLRALARAVLNSNEFLYVD